MLGAQTSKYIGAGIQEVVQGDFKKPIEKAIEGQIINRTLETSCGGQTSLFRWNTHILANNIFGVDINRESVEITKLSLWLKTANRNEKLSLLDANIRTGNSLIKERSVAGELAFDWTTGFAEIMASGRFDVVWFLPALFFRRGLISAPHTRSTHSRTSFLQ